MKKRYTALSVVIGVGLVAVLFLLPLDLSSFWDKVCDAFT